MRPALVVVYQPLAEIGLDEGELIAHVKTQVAKFKAPSRIHFVGHLPKNGIGKILRRELRDQAAELVKE